MNRKIDDRRSDNRSPVAILESIQPLINESIDRHIAHSSVIDAG